MDKLISKPTTEKRLKESPEKNLAKGGIPLKPKREKKIISLPRKFFIIGFMGSGKTHWGRIWAAKSGLNFFDLDEVIEHAFGMKITDIFEKKGEEKFRELERYHLRKFEHTKNFLLACGGGTPCFSDNMEWMKTQGPIFYLKAKAPLILEQVMNETEERPLLKKVNPSELLFFIQKKLKEREPYYSKADFILNVETLKEDSIPAVLHNK
jgi:shikimate kinase